MARRWYEDVGGGDDLNLFVDPESFNQTIDTNRLAVITEFQNLSDIARLELAGDAGEPLSVYDEMLEEEEWELRDRLDYYDLYSNRVENVTVRDGAWFTPDAVESFCGEDVGEEAVQSIDGVNSTKWKHTADERHSIIYLLRSYPKKISKIRFRYNATEPVTEQLANVDVHAAKNLAKIDDAENILETGINITWPIGQGAIWVEHTLANKKANARYIKLLMDTAHASNTLQMREFAVWVETRDP